jgi:hypothetical protein
LTARPPCPATPSGSWTTRTLAAHLAQTAGVRLSAATVRRVVHVLASRWRRPRLSLPVDPAAAAILWHLYDRIAQAPPQAAIVCLDECDLHLLPVLPVPRALWMRRGQQAGVPTPGTNRKRAVFGALEWDSGRWHSQISEHTRANEFLALLEQLLLPAGLSRPTAAACARERQHPYSARGRGVAGRASAGPPARPAGR